MMCIDNIIVSIVALLVMGGFATFLMALNYAIKEEKHYKRGDKKCQKKK